jgi:GTP-binding protein HflX
VLVSAHTRAGINRLRTVIEESLPVRERVIVALVPYSRAGLVARAHAAGEVLRAEHGPDGTLLEARVTPELAAEFNAFVVAPQALTTPEAAAVP